MVNATPPGLAQHSTRRYDRGMKKNLHPVRGACPCDSGLPYVDCCGPWHAGLKEGRHAPTPEALMRSRYSAYGLGLIDYLLATWHASTSPGDLELPPVKWLGVVDFVARCRDGNGAQRMAETSRFVRQDGRWYYIDGVMQDED